ncbi:MAG: hypothetical protein JSW58_08435 [Candidatus Latescibacterota bacterium]|nr:MAG: hypothetical protein JSW58_08435 [Candidatus Latescibacterota bacterium]
MLWEVLAVVDCVEERLELAVDDWEVERDDDAQEEALELAEDDAVVVPDVLAVVERLELAVVLRELLWLVEAVDDCEEVYDCVVLADVESEELAVVL